MTVVSPIAPNESSHKCNLGSLGSVGQSVVIHKQQKSSALLGKMNYSNVFWLSLVIIFLLIILTPPLPERSPIAVSESAQPIVSSETGAGDDYLGSGAPSTETESQTAPPESLVSSEVSVLTSLGSGDSLPLKQVVVTPPDNTPIACLPDELLSSGGVSPSDYSYARAIVFRESTCNYKAINLSSGALGYCQAMPSVHDLPGDYATDELVQLKWCHNYALRRYGSWTNAWSFWQANRWW